MLSKASIELIEKSLGLAAGTIAEGIQSEEETTINISEGTFISTADLETLKDNVRKDGYDTGAEASREMTLKDLSKSAGLETVKDPKKFLDAYKATILEKANIEPTQKITDLEASIQNLQNTIQEKDNDYAKLQGDYEQKNLYSKVESFIPQLPENLGLKKNEVVDLFMRNYEITEDGIKKGDTILKDNMEKALGLDKVVDSFVTERGWKVAPTGRGGGAGGGEAKPSTMADFKALIAEKGYNEGSMEANAVLSEMIKENPDLGDE